MITGPAGDERRRELVELSSVAEREGATSMSAPFPPGRSQPRYRVRLEFDVQILDEAQAKALAAASMGRRIRDSEDAGLQPSTSGGQSPEVAVHAVSQDMRAVSVMLALELLRRGAATLPWLEITDVDVRNERTVP